jgi:hypothetical protein
VQSPVSGSGPAVVFSEKQLASGTLTIVATIIAERAAFFRDFVRAQLNMVTADVEVRPIPVCSEQ